MKTLKDVINLMELMGVGNIYTTDLEPIMSLLKEVDIFMGKEIKILNQITYSPNPKLRSTTNIYFNKSYLRDSQLNSIFDQKNSDDIFNDIVELYSITLKMRQVDSDMEGIYLQVSQNSVKNKSEE